MMVKCNVCEKEMGSSTGCCDHAYKLENGKIVIAVKAEELNDWVEPNGICHDCGAHYGEFHHPGCDVERCRKCGGQFISCECKYTDYILEPK